MLARNTIKYEPDWMVETSTLALAFGSLMFIADVSEHLSFHGLAMLLGARSRRWAHVASSVITAFTMGVLGLFGLRAVHELWLLGSTTTTSLAVPLWFLYAIVPLVTFVWIVRIVAELFGWRDHSREQPWLV